MHKLGKEEAGRLFQIAKNHATKLNYKDFNIIDQSKNVEPNLSDVNNQNEEEEFLLKK